MASRSLFPTFQKRYNVSTERRRQTLQTQVFRWLSDLSLRRVRCHYKTRRTVDPLQNKAAARQLIPLAVRGFVESRVHLEIGLLVAHRRFDLGTIFQKERIPEKRSRSFSDAPLAVTDPDVGSASDSLLGSVVEIVPERWPHLRLEFHRGHELAFGDYNEVPLLLRAVITRQLQRRAGFDIEFFQTGIARMSATKTSMAPICDPPVTSPRVPASILPPTICFSLFLARASQ